MKKFSLGLPIATAILVLSTSATAFALTSIQSAEHKLPHDDLTGSALQAQCFIDISTTRIVAVSCLGESAGITVLTANTDKASAARPFPAVTSFHGNSQAGIANWATGWKSGNEKSGVTERCLSVADIVRPVQLTKSVTKSA